MEGIEIYPAEYTSTLTLSLNYLKKCKISFNENISFWEKYCFTPFILILMICHCISLLMYVVKALLEGLDLFKEANIIPLLLVTLQVFLKAAIVIMNKKEIKDIIDKLGLNWRTKDLTEEQVEKKNRSLKQFVFGQKVFNLIAMLSTGQNILWPLIETMYHRCVLQEESELKLPFACVYPFSVSDWWTYTAAFVFQVYCLMLTVYVYLGCNMLLVMLCSHLSNEFVLLQEDILQSKSTNKNNVADDEINMSGKPIGDIVRRHQSVIQLTQKLNAAFNKLIFINLLFATIIICFFALAAKAASGAANMVNNYAATLVVLMTVYIFCYSSEMLCISSAGVADAAAKTMWYEGDIGYQNIICFVIMRSQMACTLTSLNYLPISLRTFTKVLSTTWSYISLANTLYDERD